MLTHGITKAEAHARVSPRTLLLMLLVGGLFFFAAINVAKAAPVTPGGFLDDAGDSYFSPLPGAPVLSIELLDAIEPLSEFGFFYSSAPGTLVPIFDSADIGPPGGPQQAAGINFDAGEIVDIDSGGPLDTFAVLGGDIGFYLTIDSAVTIYSDPALNGLLGNTDLFFSFQNIANPLQWALFFEGDLGNGLTEISFNLLNPITAASVVPLPPTVYLMGSLIPILMFMSRRRKKALAS